MASLDSNSAGVVLIVDDVPDNLSVLHDALDESGYTVLVAANGETALSRARQALPNVILLDAMMPGMDGFEVARRLKADFSTQHIPIIFMTGLTETEHVVAAFNAGGTDYVSKPVRTGEVIARIHRHLSSAKQINAARSALDAFGQATLAIQRSSGAITWQTPLARQLLAKHFPAYEAVLPASLVSWAQQDQSPLNLTLGPYRLALTLHPHSEEDSALIVLREHSDDHASSLLATAFHLTKKEAEVLFWVSQGKTNKDIADILGSSPRTVHKHLEHVFSKLHVETRTAAANLALSQLNKH